MVAIQRVVSFCEARLTNVLNVQRRTTAPEVKTEKASPQAKVTAAVPFDEAAEAKCRRAREKAYNL